MTTKKRTTTKRFREQIEAALKANNKYNDGLDVMIGAMADTLKTLDLCRAEIDTLDRITVEDDYGKLSPHPVFRVQRDAQATLTKGCKALGLTYDELSQAINDGGNDFFKRMAEMNRELYE